jgi:hypothetical protein
MYWEQGNISRAKSSFFLVSGA